jgi:hypothetical protein
VAIFPKTSSNESVSSTVTCWPLTVNAPAVTAVAVDMLATVTPLTSLVALSAAEIAPDPVRREAVASWDTEISCDPLVAPVAAAVLQFEFAVLEDAVRLLNSPPAANAFEAV